MADNKLELAQKNLAAQEKITAKLKEQKELQSDIEASKLRELEYALEVQKSLGLATVELEQQIEIQKGILSGTSRLESQTKKWAKMVTTVGDDWKEGILGSILESGDAIGTIKKTLKDTFTAKNIGMSMVMNLQEAMAAIAATAVKQAVAWDNSRTAIAAATGQGHRYARQISDIAIQNVQFGIGMAEAGEALAALNSGFTQFSDLSPKAQSRITGYAARMERLGVSAGTTAQTFGHLVQGFQMTVRESQAVQEDLALTAIAIGMPPQQMAESFAASMPVLASWGKEAPKIFKSVAAASKKLGVEMSTLLSLGEQFDTFEGAASAVGKLNALIGGDVLNSYEMMNMTLDERNRAILAGIEADGESWDSMNRHKKMAIANAAGITDMAEANKLFAGGLSAYDEAQRKMKATSAEQKKLAEAQQATIKLQEKFQLLMQSLSVILLPLMQSLIEFTDKHAPTILSFLGANVPKVAVGAAATRFESSKASFARGGTNELARAIAKANEMSSGDVVLKVDDYELAKVTRRGTNRYNSVRK